MTTEKQRGDKRRTVTYALAKKNFADKGYTLLTKDEDFHGYLTKVDLVCENGHHSSMLYRTLKTKKGGCYTCYKEKNFSLNTYSGVMSAVSENGVEPLVTRKDFDPQWKKIRYRCSSCEKIKSITRGSLVRKKTSMCNECSQRASNEPKKLTYKESKEKILQFGYKLLEPKEDYDKKKNPFKKKTKVECVACGVVSYKIPNNIAQGKICKQCSEKGTSAHEKTIAEFLKGIGLRFTQNDTTILGNRQEVDFYIPSKSLAIEINGLYWHTELKGKNRRYHLSKTEMAKERGIQLIHIFENELVNKQDIVLSILQSKLGVGERVYARKTQYTRIEDKKQIKDFLNANHIQGALRSNNGIAYGLYKGDEIISIATFGKSRYNKKYEYELLRFCNKTGQSVVGGFSKLLKAFIEGHDPESIITYADRRYSDGSLYAKNGFAFIGDSTPNYFYYKSGVRLESRVKYQKHKLPAILENFDPALTERENMANHGYHRIWDCGNRVYVWVK